MSKKVYIMDETGSQYEVANITQMLDSLLDEDLIEIYSSTKYFNELNLAVEELVEAGLIEQLDGENYEAEAVQSGLDHLGGEIIKRLGQEKLDEVDNEVDTAWKLNKPDLDKYKKGE